MVTSTNELSDGSLRWEQKYHVIQRKRADQIQQKPSLEIVSCDHAWVQHHFIAIFIGNNPCSRTYETNSDVGIADESEGTRRASFREEAGEVYKPPKVYNFTFSL